MQITNSAEWQASSISMQLKELEFCSTVGGSDELSGGTVSASSEWTSFGAYATNACDNDFGGYGSYWSTDVAVAPPWTWRYDFGVGVTKSIVQVKIWPRDDVYGRAPSDFSLQYSDNDVTYTTAKSWTWTWTSNDPQLFNV